MGHRYTPFIFFLITVISSGVFSHSLAQESMSIIPKNQVELAHDNDFILLTDRYYSSGLFLTYRRRLNLGLFASEREQLTFQLQQIANTPTNIEAIDFSAFDRPYAGFSGLESSWSLTTASSYYSFGLLVGATGIVSGAGQFQRWYHDNIVLFKTPTWFTEIENSFHVNMQLHYAKEWEISPNPFSMYIALEPKAALGTKDIYLQPEIAAYFGRRNPIGTSIAYDQINSLEKEIYFAFRVGYRWVGHNAFLEGNILGDNSVFTVSPTRAVLHLGFDFHHRADKNYYKFGYRYVSKETNTVNRHQYLHLSYGRSF